nr:MAG: hypothetical protein CM15mV30_0250 [uncultured marine virus]
MRIDVIDNFLMPDEVVKNQRKVKELTWNAFERDIFQQDNVLSGMIADLNPDWREEFDDKILTKAQELTNVDLWIGRAKYECIREMKFVYLIETTIIQLFSLYEH